MTKEPESRLLRNRLSTTTTCNVFGVKPMCSLWQRVQKSHTRIEDTVPIGQHDILVCPQKCHIIREAL